MTINIKYLPMELRIMINPNNRRDDCYNCNCLAWCWLHKCGFKPLED